MPSSNPKPPAALRSGVQAARAMLLGALLVAALMAGLGLWFEASLIDVQRSRQDVAFTVGLLAIIGGLHGTVLGLLLYQIAGKVTQRDKAELPRLCTFCGLEQSAGEPLRRELTLLAEAPANYCTRCWRRRELHRLQIAVAIWLLALAVGIGAPLLLPERSAGRLLATLGLTGFLVVVLVQVLLVLHEAGHALAAYLLGMRVFRIVIGSGLPVHTWRLGLTALEWRAMPTSGYVLVGAGDPRGYRLRHFLVTAAGPLATAATFLAAWPLIDRSDTGSLAASIAGAALLWAHVWTAAGSAIPCTYTMDGRSFWSDSLALLRIPWLSRAQVRASTAWCFAQEAWESTRFGQSEAALAHLRQGVECFPDNVEIGYSLAAMLLARREAEAARRLAVGLLSQPGRTPEQQALLADLAATAILLGIIIGEARTPAAAVLPECSREEALAEAERCCVLAQQHGADADPQRRLSYAATLGALRLEQGRDDDGRNLLREALADLDNPHARAFCAAYLAWDRLRQSGPEGAKELRELARRLDPECVPLLRAEHTG